jgi:hypothetical protein
MGNRYHVLHRHLSRLSRPDDLGLGAAISSMHPVSENSSSRNCLKNSWRASGVGVSVSQKGKMGLLRPVLRTNGPLIRSLFRIFRPFLSAIR